MKLPLIENIRRFVLHRIPTDSEFVKVCENTRMSSNVTVNNQEVVEYSAKMFTTSIEFTGDDATATGQREYSREHAVRELALMVYGPVVHELVALQRDIRKGNTRGPHQICKRIDSMVAVLEGGQS